MRGESEFDGFVDQCYGRLLGYATMLTSSRDEAEDVVQEALFRCLRRWRSRSVEHQLAYARRAVFHEYLNRRRRDRREPILADPGASFVDGVAEGVVERDRLLAALGVLPPRQRAAVVARYVLDLPEKQAARELGCTTGTVRAHASRGLARLRGVLAGSVEESVAARRTR